MNRRRLRAALAATLLLAACTNRDEKAAETTAPATTPTKTPTTTPTTPPTSTPTATTPRESSPTTSSETTTTTAPKNRFGTMESPCGPAGPAGVPTIADGQNGGATLKLGTATDHGYEGFPGLTIEMLDAAKAFAGWCNAQGGIRGLPLEIDDLDGKLFNVPGAIEQACANDFAMVGGGWVFDDQMFPRFHECKMINFASYVVTPTAIAANGKVQPLPNPNGLMVTGWLEWAKRAHPDAVQKVGMLTFDLPTGTISRDRIIAGMKAIGGFDIVNQQIFNPAGEANWAPFAQKLKDDGVKMVMMVGADTVLVNFMKAAKEIGYQPELVLQDANFYAKSLVDPGNSDATQGVVVRTALTPFEEPDRYPGMKSYLDMMATYNPDGVVAGLGVQATSAYLMFATAANACLDSNNNVLERECVLAAGRQIHQWDGGGLHAASDPGNDVPPRCVILLQVQGNAWKRLYPEIGSADDTGNGFRCDDPGYVSIDIDYGDVTKGIDPTRPN